MQFSDKLKMARQQQHYTQTQVAEQLHVSPKTISSWENARSFPDISTLVKISDFYDISLDRLLREDQTMMEHYETIDKHALRDKHIFQVTYFVNLVFILGFVIVHMLSNTPPILRQYGSWLMLAFFVNLIVLATHYPNYRLWIRSWPRRILLIILTIGIATIILLPFLNQPTNIPTDINSSAYSAQAAQGYLAGAKLGIAINIIAGTLSSIFIVFGSEEILDKN
ncbi:helix-turn-helix domain-containing protein [Lacticaseibacillus chiayiensis]|uniref:helix-turn-helix domain-containing protein n=1 Tax=Lacticaseibacillus chiayiensis TaxID=2100821 RepID=UPI001011271C|nr:helix-turn-helix transcriptional regulator [Lacticaseibacillus chiayiensis]RXT57946.1 transcriptional regulator [Lacticaseibacillus chiayiensis]